MEDGQIAQQTTKWGKFKVITILVLSAWMLVLAPMIPQLVESMAPEKPTVTEITSVARVEAGFHTLAQMMSEEPRNIYDLQTQADVARASALAYDRALKAATVVELLRRDAEEYLTAAREIGERRGRDDEWMARLSDLPVSINKAEDLTIKLFSAQAERLALLAQKPEGFRMDGRNAHFKDAESELRWKHLTRSMHTIADDAEALKGDVRTWVADMVGNIDLNVG